MDELAQALSHGNEPEAILQETVRFIVPRLADLAVLVLRDDTESGRVVVGARDPELETRTRALVIQEMAAILRQATAERRSGREFQWIPKVGPAGLRSLAGRPELLQLLEALEIRSLMVVPLRVSGKIIGGMGLARVGKGDGLYRAADLASAQVLARRIAIAIEKAELQQLTQDEQRRRTRLENVLQKWIRVFDLAGWGAAIVDPDDFRIDTVNPAFARMHGYESADRLIGRLYTSLLPADRAAEPRQWSQESSHPLAYESVHLRSDGSAFPALVNVTALETSGARSYVVTVQDVTDLKRAEDRLRRAQRMEAVGRLAGGVAHEVNNMMTIILGFSDLLAAAPDLPRTRQRDVEEIRKAAIRTARVTQQLLAFSRQQILQPTDLQLGDVVMEMAAVLQHLLPANVRVETIIAPGAATVHADRAQIDQVMINLAFNARDAMPLGGTLRLQVESRYLQEADGRRLIGIPIPRGQYALLSVSDTGHGMDQATLSQVFDPFFTTKPAGTGTGLGLATVYGIVKQTGGFVWVESEPGEGTTFTVCLPQVVGPAPSKPEEQPQDRVEPRAVGATVLIVEDEEGVRDLSRRILETEGYEVIDVRSGADALAVLESMRSDLDLVLSDVVMPDMTAVELAARIHQMRPGLPILYMSGYAEEEMVDRGLLGAGHRFIQKPFTAAELADFVAQELNVARPVVGR